MEQKEPLVFTDSWLEQLKEWHSKKEETKRPFIFHLAHKECFKAVRFQLELLVSELPVSVHPRVVGDLRSEDHYWHTCYMLIVGRMLRQRGSETRYEPCINGKTPDWIVSSADGSQVFIAEVTTFDPPREQRAWDGKLNDLLCRIRKIPLDYELQIASVDQVPELDDREKKRITYALLSWLKDGPTVTAQRKVAGLTFQVLRSNSGLGCVQCSGYGVFRPVRSDVLAENIKAKAKKYEALAADVPFLVVVAPEFETGIDVRHMHQAVFGERIGRCTRDRVSGKWGQPVERFVPGLFEKRPLLSATALLHRPDLIHWKLKYFINPNAKHLLSPGLLGE